MDIAEFLEAMRKGEAARSGKQILHADDEQKHQLCIGADGTGYITDDENLRAVLAGGSPAGLEQQAIGGEIVSQGAGQIEMTALGDFPATFDLATQALYDFGDEPPALADLVVIELLDTSV